MEKHSVISILLCAGISVWALQWVFAGFGNFFQGRVSADNREFLAGLAAGSAQDARPEADNYRMPAAVSPAPLPALAHPVEELPPVVVQAPEINAEAALAIRVDGDSQETVFSHNASQQLPVASLTKLMSALVVLEHYDLNYITVVSKTAMAQEGEQGGLKLNEALSVKNLLYIMLIESSNRAAKALSEMIGTEEFVRLMNEHARLLGMEDTHFDDSTGLSPKSHSTTQDIARLSRHLFEQYPLFKTIISLDQFNLYFENGQLHHVLENTNKLLGRPGVIGGKTGWTNEAKGCMMIIKASEDGSYYIYVVLGAEDRFTQMEKLMRISN